MSSTLALAARVISEGFLPAKSALLQGPGQTVGGPVPPDRLRGMLLGLAIGDALGNTSESLSPAERVAQYAEIRDYLPNRHASGSRVGLPSDDSQLAFWTLESLLERGELDPDDLAARFAAREIFGLGKSVRQFLDNRAQGITPWYRCSAESAGNGALMRIAPVVLLHPRGRARRCGSTRHSPRSSRTATRVGRLMRRVHRPAGTPVAARSTADRGVGHVHLPGHGAAGLHRRALPRARRPLPRWHGTFPGLPRCGARRGDAARLGHTRRPARPGTPAPTCSRPCRACCGSSPGTCTTRKKPSSAP